MPLPRVISLCPGAGVGETGSRQHFHSVIGVDDWWTACCSFMANHPGVQVVCKDIRDKQVIGAVKQVCVGTIDGIISSTPCVLFSEANKLASRSAAEHPDFLLYLEPLRWVEAFKPKLYIAENVKGVLNSPLLRMKAAMLERLGYKWAVWVLDAADYGAPQHRARAFLVAVQEGIPLPQCPKGLPSDDEPAAPLTATACAGPSTLPSAPHVDRIVEGDALEVLKRLPAESINSCATSPPYYMMRDYRMPGQLGWEPTVEEYIGKLVAIFGEVRRVLCPDGTLWLYMGDSHANGAIRSQQELRSSALFSTRRFRRGQKVGILRIPWRLALALQSDGWLLCSEIIRHKPAVIPLGGQRHPVVAHETIFLLAKERGYYYGRDDIRERTGNEMTWKDYETQRGKSWRRIRADDAQQGRCRLDSKPLPGTHPQGRDCRSVWRIASQHQAKGARDDEHYATYPPDLARRMILGGRPAVRASVGATIPVSRRRTRTNQDAGISAALNRFIASASPELLASLGTIQGALPRGRRTP